MSQYTMNTPQKPKDFRQRLHEMIIDCANECEYNIRRKYAPAGLPVHMYLYYKESTPEGDGKLKLFHADDTPPPPWKLADPVGFRGDLPYSQYGEWIRARATRLPNLCTND